MTQTNHTPGPWTNVGGYVEALDLDTPLSICTLADCGTETEANGRLIAAAPDMLDALERAYQKLSFWMDDDKWDHGDEKALELIWAAIAKAKGE